MKKILIASTNKGKVKQIKKVLDLFGIDNVCSLKDVQPVEEPEEFGTNCQQNAFIKASYYVKNYPDYCVLADDSGIFIDAFNGAPGIYSARWGGAHTTENIREKLVSEMKKHNVSESPAYYECSMVLMDKERDLTISVIEKFDGIIKDVPSGTFRDGLAYDPYFYINDDYTAANLNDIDEDLLLEINHRGKAAFQMACNIAKEYHEEW